MTVPEHLPPARRSRLPWLVALVVVIALIAFGVSAELRHATNPRVPDLSALTESSQVKSLDAATRTGLALQFSQISRDAPWLTGRTSGVLDSCQLYSQESQVVLSQASWSAQCQREETFFYVFDGNLASRLREFQHVLISQGWTDFSPVPQVASSPTETHTADASMTPNGPPMTAIPGTEGALTAVPGKVGIEVGWCTRARPLAPVATLGITGPGAKADSKLYRATQFQSADLYSVARQNFPQHEYVLAVRITVQYYEDPDLSSSPLPSG